MFELAERIRAPINSGLGCGIEYFDSWIARELRDAKGNREVFFFEKILHRPMKGSDFTGEIKVSYSASIRVLLTADISSRLPVASRGIGLVLFLVIFSTDGSRV